MNIIKYKKDITLSNKIIEAKYSLTREEQNLIFLLISQIDRNDEDFKKYVISIKDLNLLHPTQKNHSYIKKIAQNIMSRTLTIYEENNKNFTIYNWISSIKYIDDKACLVVELHKDLKPFFLQLKKEFTRSEVHLLFEFKSKYSSRLYLLLKSHFDKQKKYKDIAIIEYEVDFLLNHFNMPTSYKKKYINFKNKFLLKSINEINEKSDFFVNFEEIKTSRKITSILFNITKKNDDVIENKKNDDDINIYSFLNQLSDKAKDIVLNYCDFKDEDLKNIFKKYKIDDLEEIALKVYNKYEKINNTQAFFRSELKKINENNN